MRAMILAAGFGTRLAPLTNLRPKCLMPVGRRTLLGLWLERLAGWGVGSAVVNTHHLREMVRPRLEQGWPGLEVIENYEPVPLGTGGGLVAARAALGDKLFFVAHADGLASVQPPPFQDILRASGAIAVLGMKNEERFNTVALDAEGRVLGFKGDDGLPKDANWRTYTGLAAIHPRLLEYLPASGFSSIVKGLRKAINAGEAVLGIRQDGFWDDLGTPERLLLLHRDLARGALPEIAAVVGKGPLWIDQNAQIAPDASLQGFVLAGRGVGVAEGAMVKNSLLLPGARVQAGVGVESAVLGDGFIARNDIKGGAHA